MGLLSTNPQTFSLYRFGTPSDVRHSVSISKSTYTTLNHRATIGRFIMTTHTTLSAATQAGRKDRSPITGVLRTPTPPQTTAFLIANPELKLTVSNRKTSPLKIPNRKKIALSPQWHRHSCLCAVASPRIPPTEAVTSLPPSPQNLIETPRLKFPATTTKLSPLPISGNNILDKSDGLEYRWRR